MRDLLRTALTGGTVLGLTGSIAPLVTLLSYLDQQLPDPLIRFWARSILRAAGVRAQLSGLDKLPGGNFVLAMNHQSHFDAPVLLSLVPRHLRFVGKAELFRIPIFGAALAATGNLPVDRKGAEKDRATVRHAVRGLREKTSVVFFAEGTRSEDGALGPFKKGAAVLAIEAQVPLVPAAVAGTRGILPKGGRLIRGGQSVALAIGEPLETTGLAFEDRDRLTDLARDAVARLLKEASGLAGRLATGGDGSR
ncbi:MAG: 1-acyl-sn-glycerol-3-phosphate acyltransferase [Myxococcales bacterium]|nr:1-acyl-sn-glycerol-3-phosphate acyltransferase [Myxococcales bacterium]